MVAISDTSYQYPGVNRDNRKCVEVTDHGQLVSNTLHNNPHLPLWSMDKIPPEMFKTFYEIKSHWIPRLVPTIDSKPSEWPVCM